MDETNDTTDRASGLSELEILDRVSVVGDDGTTFIALQRRFVSYSDTAKGVRRMIGARFWQLVDGTRITQIDAETFLIDKTGELLCRSP